MEFGLNYSAENSNIVLRENEYGLDEAYMTYLNLVFQDQISYFSSSYNIIDLDKNQTISDILRLGYILCLVENQPRIIVRDGCLQHFESLLTKYPGRKILVCKNQIFFEIIEFQHKQDIVYLAKYLQRFLNPKSNAYLLNSYYTRLIIFLLPILLLFLSIYTGVLIYAANGIYLIQTLFKLAIFKSSIKYQTLKNRKTLQYSELPIYTILIPLYREASKVNQVLDNICKLNYPKEKLDIKIVLESDDTQTYKALTLADMPENIHIIKVPSSMPQTKPKACNYAMQFALGELLVIYDAEDIPEPDQLLKAVAQYQNLDDSYACLQAKLKIQHSKYDVLGFLFKLEYEMWFSYLLKGMSLANLPIPLGGTSNHFKVSALRDLGYWDAYNVTEDADIGIRMSLRGYKIDMLDSSTIEEPPISIYGWMKQRIRWIKGFMITFFSYICQDKAKQGVLEKISIVIFIGFSVASFLISPVILWNGFFLENTKILQILSDLNIAIFLIFFWAAAYFLIKSSAIEHNFINIIAIIIFPLYFVLHSIAAYFAIVEIMWKPFRWNKTDHLL